jgi:hypothetical protein
MKPYIVWFFKSSAKKAYGFFSLEVLRHPVCQQGLVKRGGMAVKKP